MPTEKDMVPLAFAKKVPAESRADDRNSDLSKRGEAKLHAATQTLTRVARENADRD